MTEIKLQAAKRIIPTPALNQARKAGKITAELYGAGQKNQHLFLSGAELEKVYKRAGESSLIDLAIEGEAPVKVLIHEVQRNPLTDRVEHLDLYQVRMDQVLTTEIPLVFFGESKAVKELGGTLIKSLEKIEITCLPQDLIPQVEVDISGLVNFHDVIRVKDLKIPATIKVLTNAEEAIATALPVEVEKEAPVEAPSAAAEATAPAGEAGSPRAEPRGEAGKEGETPSAPVPETPEKPQKK